MSPITHLMLSWLVAEIPGNLSRRDRALITFAGVVPDLDGLGAIPEIATLGRESPLLWFTEYHHTLHTLCFAAIVLVLAVALSRRKAIVGCLSLVAFHLHLICDVLGARGPDGYSWPIPYLQPFSSHLQLEWEGQWYLNAWPNFAVTGAALSLMALAGLPLSATDPTVKDTLTAQQIIDRAVAVYAECTSYKDTGTVVTTYTTPDRTWSEELQFSTAFVRPDRFRFEYKEKDSFKKQRRYLIWRKGEHDEKA